MRFLLPMLVLPLLAMFLHADDKKSLEDLLTESRAALKAEKFDEALKAADAAVKLDEKSAPAHFRRGEALGRLRRSAEAIAAYDNALKLDPKAVIAADRRGGEYFKIGEFQKSLADFDTFLKAEPKAAPAHWQRGITLYYLGKFPEGAKQFHDGQVAFGNDVENAFWHWLCLARRDGAEKARKELLKVGPDARVPMAEIYKMVEGKLTPEEVLKAAAKDGSRGEPEIERLFYAHLYIGLYQEGIGEKKKALEHLKEAVKRPISHYMWDVANVHVMTLEKK